MTTDETLRDAVREHYARAVTGATGCCGPTVPAGEGPFGAALYGDSDRAMLPVAALQASFGCGNPTALADLHPGEDVLDLGSGGGIDVLLSARRVGPDGMAYGVDMTPQMLEVARRNQAESGLDNATFLLGTIEEVPLPDDAVDVVISNCVVNLSADKPAVLREAFRVLRPGGRLAISDIVLRQPLPTDLAGLVRLWTGCVAGAMQEDDLRDQLAAAGFVDVEIAVVHVYGRAELGAMAGTAGSLGDSTPDADPADVDDALDRLDGVVASAFVRGRVPEAG